MVLIGYYKFLAGSSLQSANETTQIVCITGVSNDVKVAYNDGTKKEVTDALGFKKLDTILTSQNRSSSGVVFGDGTEAAALNDYWLAGNVVKGITVSANIERSEEADGTTLTATYTVTNNNADAVTIGEVLYQHYLNLADPVALERSVFESPLTIPSGGVGQITLTIRLNFPTA